MGKGRLEAFSAGVIATIITIIVLELKVPHGDSIDILWPLMPVLLSYVLSFIYVGIYWNKHQHASYPSGRGCAVLGTFGFAILASGCTPNLNKADEETQIQQAVLRYQFEHNAAARKYNIFCIAIGDRETSLDAPTQLIDGLNDAGHKVIKFSACNANDGEGVTERVSGNPALMLSVAQVKWLASDEVLVDGGYYEASLSASGNTYHLKKIEGMWRVVKDEMNWIS